MTDDLKERRRAARRSRLHGIAATVLCAAFATLPLTAAAQLKPPAAMQPSPRLPQVQIQAGIHLIKAEVAADATTRTRGLMMRERLGPNEGMLFVFPERGQQCFWMRNTLVPLSAAFLDDDGTIVNIADMTPLSEESHCSLKPVRYVLEMEQGWFARRGMGPGSRLSEPRFFPAQQTK
jgi:uncharacterized protein